MRYVIFEKDIRSVQWGLGQSPRSWGMFENFRVKSKITLCKVTFDCKLQKHNIGGAGCTSCSPIILLMEHTLLLPLLPGSRTYGHDKCRTA